MTNAISKDAVPLLSPGAIHVHHDGMQWREHLLRLPEGFSFEMLLLCPGAWVKIQRRQAAAVRRFDRVTAIAHDESWIARDLLVVDASEQGVHLLGRASDKQMLKPPSDVWEDEFHRIQFGGDGFEIVSRTTHRRVIPVVYASLDAAKRGYVHNGLGQIEGVP